jgi:hypothetical protein
MIMTDLTADVLVDGPLPAEREALIHQALATLGASGRIRVLPPLRGATELQWLVMMTLPLQAFLGSIGSKFGEDAYRSFQNIVRKLLHPDDTPPAAPTRPIVLKDAASGLRIVLDLDLPPEGYQQLLTLNLSQFRFGPVHYDRAERRWRSEIDEAEATNR